MVVSTYPSTGMWGEKKNVRLQKKKMRRSRHQRLFKENVRKNKKHGLRILKIRVRELFMHGKGISTPRIRHKGRQPLIECAKHDFKITYFPFLYFFIFWGRQGGALAPTDPQVRWGIQTHVVL